MQRVDVRRPDHSRCGGASKPAHRAQPSVCGRGGRGDEVVSKIDVEGVRHAFGCVYWFLRYACRTGIRGGGGMPGGRCDGDRFATSGECHACGLTPRSEQLGWVLPGGRPGHSKSRTAPFQVRGGRRAQPDQMVESPQDAALPCGRDRAPALGSRAYGDVSRGEVGPDAHAYPGGRVAGERGPLVTRSRRPRPQAPRPESQPSLADHYGWSPTWTCEKCGKPWPCPAWTRRPTDPALVQALLPGFTRMASMAIRDLRGRSEGSEPAEIVKRFLWFMPLSEEEARTTALRLR